MQDTGQPLSSGLIPIAVLVMCEIALSVLMLKNMRFRRFVCGKPIVVINNGKIDQREMRALRMSTEDLSEQLRQRSIFQRRRRCLCDCRNQRKNECHKKPDKETATAGMLGIALPDKGIETVVISDGNFLISRYNYATNPGPGWKGF